MLCKCFVFTGPVLLCNLLLKNWYILMSSANLEIQRNKGWGVASFTTGTGFDLVCNYITSLRNCHTQNYIINNTHRKYIFPCKYNYCETNRILNIWDYIWYYYMILNILLGFYILSRSLWYLGILKTAYEVVFIAWLTSLATIMVCLVVRLCFHIRCPLSLQS